MRIAPIGPHTQRVINNDDDDDDDDDDHADTQKMTGDLSCGQTNILHAMPQVSILTMFSPMEKRMNHAKSKTVPFTQSTCVFQRTLHY